MRDFRRDVVGKLENLFLFIIRAKRVSVRHASSA